MSLKIVLVLSTLYFSDEIVWLIIIENKILEMPCTHKQKQTNRNKRTKKLNITEIRKLPSDFLFFFVRCIYKIIYIVSKLLRNLLIVTLSVCK